MRQLTLAIFYGCLGFGRNNHSLYILVWAKTQMTLHLFMVNYHAPFRGCLGQAQIPLIFCLYFPPTSLFLSFH